MRLGRWRWMLALTWMLTGCGEEPSRGAVAPPLPALSDGLHTSVVKLLREGAGGSYDPVVLSRASDGSWSAAFRLLCSDAACTKALHAFGYENTFDWSRSFDDLDLLRAGMRLPDAIELVELAMAPNSVLEAFRVVDAPTGAPPYYVRLAADPKRLYAISCRNFLEVFRGDIATVPINVALTKEWGPAFAQAREISCNTATGIALPAPAPAPIIGHAADTVISAEVWNVPYTPSEKRPYLIVRDATGVRSYQIDCGSESLNALRALGFAPADVRPHDSDEAFLATRPNEQPVLRCEKNGTRPIRAYTSSNEAPSGVRFKLDSKPYLVEFGCASARAYWLQRATTQIELPAQALPYVGLDASLADPSGPQRSTLLRVGCKVDSLPPVPVSDGQVVYFRKRFSLGPTDDAATGRCLDVPWSQTASGLRLQSFACNGSSAQTFRVSSAGEGLWSFRRTGTSLCVDVGGGPLATGTPVVQNPCTDSLTQRFELETRPSGAQLRVAGTDLCVDIPGSSNASGTVIQLAPCNDHDGQVFALLSPRLRKARTANGKFMCIDVPGATLAPTTQVQLRECDGSDGQQWQKLGIATATVEIRRGVSELCLGAPFGAYKGAPVMQLTCRGGAEQTWQSDTSGRNAEIRLHGTDLCIDAPNNADAAGTPLQLWTCNDTSAQLFNL